jgi:hypothetical protein
MLDDIRTKPFITHDDVVRLNFIKSDSAYHFRRHFRQGLRSHVIEVLRGTDIDVEKFGIDIDGIRRYPRAKPIRILRLFRTRLSGLGDALEEIRRVKLVERYLAPDFLARSNEFIVEYVTAGGRGILLCGLQEFVGGEILNPWGLLSGERLLETVYDHLIQTADPSSRKSEWIQTVRTEVTRFISCVKQMIIETGHIPDLAGMGNLVIVSSGRVKLVDINNIAQVAFTPEIDLDDKGYPVCDKSIEALAHLEVKLLGNAIDPIDRIYRFFLNPARMQRVAEKERIFYREVKFRNGVDSAPQRGIE